MEVAEPNPHLEKPHNPVANLRIRETDYTVEVQGKDLEAPWRIAGCESTLEDQRNWSQMSKGTLAGTGILTQEEWNQKP